MHSTPTIPGRCPNLLWVTENYYPSRGGMAWSCDRIVHGLRRLGLRVDVLYFRRRSTPQGRVQAFDRRNGRDLIWPVGDDPAHAMNCAWNYLGVRPETPAWTPAGGAQTAGNPSPPSRLSHSPRTCAPSSESKPGFPAGLLEARSGYSHVVAFGGLLPLLAAPVYAAWLGCPLVTLLRGNDFDIGIFNAKRSDLLHRALEKSARVCVVSRDKVAKVAALFPAREPPVWIPNGIDLAHWKALPADLERAAAWRTENVPENVPENAPEGRRVLGFFGQIKKKKGGLFFLENLRRTDLLDRFHLLFVGDLSPGITDWLAAHEGQVSVSRQPFLDRYQLLPLYRACDLVVIPSVLRWPAQCAARSRWPRPAAPGLPRRGHGRCPGRWSPRLPVPTRRRHRLPPCDPPRRRGQRPGVARTGGSSPGADPVAL